MDIEQRLGSVRGRITTATQEEARNDVLRERGLHERQQALDALKLEFNVDSVVEAEELRNRLRDELVSAVKELEELLDSLGA